MAAYRLILPAVLMMSLANNSLADEPAQAGANEDVKAVAWGNNCFAIRLYQKLQADEGNLFFSPYSISTALAMTYAGAKGETREQMAQALCFPTSPEVLKTLAPDWKPMTQEEFARAFGRIIKDLNARGGQDKYELRVANALWGQEDYRFLPDFVQLVEEQYGGALREVDFVRATERARQTINAWVEKQTNDKIKDLISPGVLDAMTRLVLTNAIYFKGNWATQFKEDRTREEPFTLLDGSKVQVPMMNQKEQFGYMETDGLQGLEMPYVGEELSMVILLPKEITGIDKLEKELTAERVCEWLGRIHEREVIVSVPKFKMTSKFGLGKVLRAMGMTAAFSKNADFSGMTGSRDLFISAVVHQAYVDVNEEGTEAAAATGVVMRLTSVAPGGIPVFRADHPFIFLIRDKTSGSILFLGRLINPLAG